MQIHLLQDPESFHSNQAGMFCSRLVQTLQTNIMSCFYGSLRSLLSHLQINGQWKGISAGGCGNYKDSYKNNPIYQVNLERPGPLLIELRGSRSGRVMSVIASEMIVLDLWSISVFSGLVMSFKKNIQVKCDPAVPRPYHKTATRSKQNEKLSIATQLAGL